MLPVTSGDLVCLTDEAGEPSAVEVRQSGQHLAIRFANAGCEMRLLDFFAAAEAQADPIYLFASPDTRAPVEPEAFLPSRLPGVGAMVRYANDRLGDSVTEARFDAQSVIDPVEDSVLEVVDKHGESIEIRRPGKDGCRLVSFELDLGKNVRSPEREDLMPLAAVA